MIGDYIVDFYCAGAKLAIELDGSGHYEPAEMEKDEQRTERLRQQGVSVIRFCNLDVDRNFEGVCAAIERAVQERYKRGTPPV